MSGAYLNKLHKKVIFLLVNYIFLLYFQAAVSHFIDYYLIFNYTDIRVGIKA